MNKSSADHVYFLVKDPHWTFVWWELSSTTVQNITAITNKEVTEIPFYLRIHVITGVSFDGYNSYPYFDIEVHDYTDHWYLYIPLSNRSYFVEVGFKIEGQDFLPVVRSNRISLPRDCPSNCMDEFWSSIIFPEPEE